MPATTVTDASTPTPTHASERGQPLDRWIAVDWGTTRLRAMLVTEGERESGSHSDDRAPTLLEERSSAQGLASLANQGTQAFDDALATLIEGWQPLPILMCGMVGSRQGWQEIPYQTISEGAPLDLRTLQAVAINSQTAIMPGVCQASPPDVMRGEETQLLGLATKTGDDLEGLVCMTGTHCKWVRMSGYAVQEFHTFMTGELFALLTTHSLLKHSTAIAAADQRINPTASTAPPPQDTAHALFIEGVHTGYADFGWKDLFKVRSRDLLNGITGEAARQWLSGLLIGAEIASAQASLMPGAGEKSEAIGASSTIHLVGGQTNTKQYLHAIQALGNFSVVVHNQSELALLGLQRVRKAGLVA